MSTSLCERHYPLCQPFETVPMTLVNVSVKEFLESDSSHLRYMYFTSKCSHWQTESDFFCEGPHVLCVLSMTAPLEIWQPPLKEKIVTSLEVQEDETIVPKLVDGDRPLPWSQQVWGGFGLNQTAFYASLYGIDAGGFVLRSFRPCCCVRLTSWSSEDSIDPHASLWLSQSNVTAHWHYDCSHNW
jgi:hypothetical protein